MRHSHLVDKYDKAQMHFKKGNYRKARRMFKSIVFELFSSDTDSMADIQLHNSAMRYLNEIEGKDLSLNKGYLISITFAIVVVIGIILYFIFK